MGTLTLSWFILNFLFLLNCNNRSHESRNLLGHLPGKEFFLCQTNSSVHNQPCFLISNINSITYVCRSPFITFSLMFNMKVPVGFNTLNNSPEIGRNQSTYLFGCTPPYVVLL